MVGFEPTISCSRNTRITRLSHTLLVKGSGDRGPSLTPDSCSLTPSSSSAQRESNPHFRHGKATGCRYIMGSMEHQPNCQRTDRAWGRTRTGVSGDQRSRGAQGVGVLAAERPVRFQETGVAFDPTPASRLLPQWAGRRSNPPLRFFRPPLYHLSYQPNQNKKTRRLATPGFGIPTDDLAVRCHKRSSSANG